MRQRVSKYFCARLPTLTGQKFLDVPDRGYDTGGHSGSDPQAAVDPAKIVICEMQRRSGLEVVKLLAESVGQPRQPPHGHSHR